MSNRLEMKRREYVEGYKKRVLSVKNNTLLEVRK